MAHAAKKPRPPRVLSAEEFDPRLDPMGSRILDAAFEQFCLLGIRRSSMEDIARRADVGRVTLYRRFESKERLVAALWRRETHRAIAKVEAAVAAAADPEDRFVEGFLAGMGAFRRHPLLIALLATEPEAVLPLLTVKAESGLVLARTFMAQEIRRARADLGLPETDAEQIAEVFARLTHSLALTPGTCLPIDDEAAAREFARTHIVPMVTGRPARRRGRGGTT